MRALFKLVLIHCYGLLKIEPTDEIHKKKLNGFSIRILLWSRIILKFVFIALGIYLISKFSYFINEYLMKLNN